MPSIEDSIIVIAGATATGKSSLAIALAQAIDAEIVSADSMQVYRGMDIGTAKVPIAERKVKHFGIDLVDPGEPFSAALFQEHARWAFGKIADKHKRHILAGGTGFYIRAAIDDYHFVEGEQVGNPVRDKYVSIVEHDGALAVWKLLDERDPESAALIHPHDSKRVIRALEMLESGTQYSVQRKRLKEIPQRYPALFIGISVKRETLRKRIDKRVDCMREAGLVKEVERLVDEGFRDAITSNQAIGYKEIVRALEGGCTLDEAFESIKTSTKRYAKRQDTWFGGDARYRWIDGESGSIDAMLEQTFDLLKSEGIVV